MTLLERYYLHVELCKALSIVKAKSYDEWLEVDAKAIFKGE
jgi:hypothetical protein